MMKGKKNSDLCTIYILLWLIGFVQNIFLTSSFFSLLFSIPSMLITIYCFVKMVEKCPPKGVMKPLSIFFVVLIIYGLVMFLLDDVMTPYGKLAKTSFIIMVFNSLGPIIAFYYFTVQGYLDANRLRFWFFVFFAVSIVSYYDYEQRAMTRLMESASRFEEVTNNTTYLILALFPFLFLFEKRPVIQYFALAIILFFVVSGMKRGAAAVAAVLLVWFVIVSTRHSSKNRRLLILVLTVGIIVVGWNFIDQLYKRSDYLQFRVNDTIEGGSSTRDMIFTTLWRHYWNNNNMFQLAFGEGAYHTYNIAGNDAHNDWLELLIDCGFITTLIYLIFWVRYYNDWKKSKQIHLLYSIMGASFFYMLMRTFFSMSFSNMPFSLSMIVGYCFAQSNKPITQIDASLI